MMELSSRDLEEIRDLHDRWIAKELEGDALGVLKLCTDDVQWLAPNAGPVAGKVAARELLAEPGVEIQKIQTDDISIHGDGSLAYKTCTYRTSYTTDRSVELRTAEGTHLWILRKTDGVWRVAFVTWQPAAANQLASAARR